MNTLIDHRYTINIYIYMYNDRWSHWFTTWTVWAWWFVSKSLAVISDWQWRTLILLKQKVDPLKDMDVFNFWYIHTPTHMYIYIYTITYIYIIYLYVCNMYIYIYTYEQGHNYWPSWADVFFTAGVVIKRTDLVDPGWKATFLRFIGSFCTSAVPLRI